MLTVRRRRASLWRSTHPLYDLTACLADGSTTEAIGKTAPTREIEAYRTVLHRSDLDVPVFLGTCGTDLILEHVDGVPLWQCELPAWQEAARALGRLHARATPGSMCDWPGWWEGAFDALGYATAVQCAQRTLAGAPRVLVHGEAYPANVLVRPNDTICLLDWESAASGPAAIDIAALITGWSEPAAASLIAAYTTTAPRAVPENELAAARLLFAVRWLTCPDVVPGPNETVDWRRELQNSTLVLPCVH